MWSHATRIKSADVKRSAQEEMVTVQRQPSRTVAFRACIDLGESGSLLHTKLLRFEPARAQRIRIPI